MTDAELVVVMTDLLNEIVIELEGINGLLTLGLLQQGLTIEQIDAFLAKQRP